MGCALFRTYKNTIRYIMPTKWNVGAKVVSRRWVGLLVDTRQRAGAIKNKK